MRECVSDLFCVCILYALYMHFIYWVYAKYMVDYGSLRVEEMKS